MFRSGRSGTAVRVRARAEAGNGQAEPVATAAREAPASAGDDSANEVVGRLPDDAVPASGRQYDVVWRRARKSQRQYARCRSSVPLRARLLFEQACKDLVDHCAKPAGWAARYLVGPELVVRPEGGTHILFLLAKRECKRAHGYGVPRGEVMLIHARPVPYDSWQLCVESMCFEGGHDIAMVMEALDGPYVMDADATMSWDEGRSFTGIIRRQGANLVCYRGNDLSGVAHSLCEDGTPDVNVKAMLKREPAVGGAPCSWAFA